MFTTFDRFREWAFYESLIRDFERIDPSVSPEDIYHTWFENENGLEPESNLFVGIRKGLEKIVSAPHIDNWEVRETYTRTKVFELLRNDPVLTEFALPMANQPELILKAKTRILAEHTFYCFRNIHWGLQRFDGSWYETLYHSNGSVEFADEPPTMAFMLQSLIHRDWIEVLVNDVDTGFDEAKNVSEELITGAALLLALHWYNNPQPIPILSCNTFTMALTLFRVIETLQGSNMNHRHCYHQGTRVFDYLIENGEDRYPVTDFAYSCFVHMLSVTNKRRDEVLFDEVPMLTFEAPDVEGYTKYLRELAKHYFPVIAATYPWVFLAGTSLNWPTH
jgi:hypothetical protein